MENSKPNRWRASEGRGSEGATKAREIRAVALRLNMIADELEANPALVAELAIPDEPLGPFPDLESGAAGLSDLSRAIYKARQRRNRWFDPAIFGEPAWDILLDLYEHQVSGKRLTTKSVCVASAVAPTTALRWIAVLEEAGLLRRTPSEIDRRKMFVELTELGFRSMTFYLLEFRGASRKAPGQ